MDLEGDELYKNGTLTILAVMVVPHNRAYIVDVQKLQQSTFSTVGQGGTPLKSILESPGITKVYFDVRNDSNALFFLYEVSLQGVQDIQLMENASRKDFGRGGRFRSFVAGLAKCIEADAGLTHRDLVAWKATKDRIKARFNASAPIHVFAQRPLDEDALLYCAEDVRLLPRLRTTYWGRLNPAWTRKVEKETLKRVRDSQTTSYVPRGRHKALGPW